MSVRQAGQVALAGLLGGLRVGDEGAGEGGVVGGSQTGEFLQQGAAGLVAGVEIEQAGAVEQGGGLGLAVGECILRPAEAQAPLVRVSQTRRDLNLRAPTSSREL
ncbi:MULTISPECIES: hypothetical protein [unclassified Streptomyces]|uniref:hypothetical protein n=1 Tax=unclassified Streptomyces TaxID=2593676 RepID=UPI003423470C